MPKRVMKRSKRFPGDKSSSSIDSALSLEKITRTSCPELLPNLDKHNAVVLRKKLKAVEDELKAAEDELKAAEDELKAAEDELKAAEDELKAEKGKRVAVEEKIEAAEDELKAEKGKRVAVEEKLEAPEDELKAVKDKLKAVKDELKAVKDELKAVKDELEVANNRIDSKPQLRELVRGFKDSEFDKDLMSRVRRKHRGVFRHHNNSFVANISYLTKQQLKETGNEKRKEIDTKLGYLLKVATTSKFPSLDWWNEDMAAQLFYLCKIVSLWNSLTFHPRIRGTELRDTMTNHAHLGYYKIDTNTGEFCKEGMNFGPITRELLHME